MKKTAWATLEGEKRLATQLRSMDKRVARILLKSVRAGGKPLLAEARRRAPEDKSGAPPKKNRKHGRLKKGGIQIKTMKRKRMYAQAALTNTTEGAHAALQELGTTEHAIQYKGKPRKQPKKHPGHEAQPFFRPAYEATKHEIERTVKGVIVHEIRKAAK